MRETKQVRATLRRVPFQGEPGRFLPGPAVEFDPATRRRRIVGPGPSMPVPWTAYWRQRLVDRLIELESEPEPEPAAPAHAVSEEQS